MKPEDTDKSSIKTAVIVPTITAPNKVIFKSNFMALTKFCNQLHIDISDGIFTPVKLPIYRNWLLKNRKDIKLDFHLMVRNPAKYAKKIIRLNPSAIYVHADVKHATKVLADLKKFNSCKIGAAISNASELKSIASILPKLDSVLIFAGKLGHQGGEADMGKVVLIEKILKINPDLEISWDGGINSENIGFLKTAGVVIFNVGAAISSKPDKLEEYSKLEMMV